MEAAREALNPGLAYYNEFDPRAAAWLRNLIRDGLISPGTVDERSIENVTADDLRGYRRVHFFAGIAGWELALQIAGWTTEPVWTGSCPCQPFSAAGKRKGTDDARHLWPEMFRLVRECRPSVVIGEQVESAIRLGWLDGVFADLEGEGYACGATVLGAHSVGAPHIRQRLFWVADLSGGRRREELKSNIGGCSGGTIPRQARSRSSGADLGMADAGGTRLEGETGAVRGVARLGVAAQHGCNRRLGDMLGSGPQGYREPGQQPDSGEWEGTERHGSTAGVWSDAELVYCRDEKYRRIERGSFPLAHGIPAKLGQGFAGLDGVGHRAARSNRVTRLKGYGNAIVPQVAAEFIRAFMESR